MILSGKTAIVTAAGSGIGRAGSLAMAREGAFVVVTDRNLEAARETVRLVEAASGKAEARRLDVSDDEAIGLLEQLLAKRMTVVEVTLTSGPRNAITQ